MLPTELLFFPPDCFFLRLAGEQEVWWLPGGLQAVTRAGRRAAGGKLK